MGKGKIQSKMEYFVNLANTKPAVNWNGSNVITLFFTPYLLSKYNSNCYFFLPSQTEFNGLVFDDNPYFNRKKQVETLKEVTNKISECITNGGANDIIIIPFNLLLTEIVDGKNRRTRHANMIIYRKKTNQFEHFEPHGSLILTDSDLDLDGDLNEKINKYILKFVAGVNAVLPNLNSTLLSASDICPDVMGLQSLESQYIGRPNKGFCAAWAMFFTEMVLANPKYTSREVHDMILSLGRKDDNGRYLRSMIVGYSIHVNDILERYYSTIFGFQTTLENIGNRFDDYLSLCLYFLNYIEDMRFNKKTEVEIHNMINNEFIQNIDDWLVKNHLSHEHKQNLLSFLMRLKGKTMVNQSKTPDSDSMPDFNFVLTKKQGSKKKKKTKKEKKSKKSTFKFKLTKKNTYTKHKLGIS